MKLTQHTVRLHPFHSNDSTNMMIGMIGETISHYRILERLGTGGMGEVYKAEDLRLHRHVALKVLLAELSDDEHSKQLHARFIREAQAASALNHPNIAAIYEIDETVRNGARYSFIVMEYVPGHTLKQASHTFTVAEALEIIAQIADALSQAHERGIVHRDIKASNVIIGEHHRVKLLDFGIAKYNSLHNSEADTASLFHTESLKTQPGTVLGTFAYMSPEQALGQDVDGRSDIFSLGVLFYELLAGRLPFLGPSTLAVVDAVLHSAPFPLSQLNQHVNRELELLVHRMIEKEAARRYQTMHDVLDALSVLRQNLPAATFSLETNVGYATQLLATSNAGTRSLSGRTSQSIAVMSFTNITRNPADNWIGTGIAETVMADLKNIEGLAVIGRERIYEVLRRWRIEENAEVDTALASSLGREVKARWIVGGGYQKLGEMLRITARFVEVETGEIVKTVKIDGTINDIFALQDKIVDELSQGLKLSLRRSEGENIQPKDTEIVAAYEAYCKAEMSLDTGSREGIEQAIKWLNEAIALDPNYARAHAGLGYAMTIKGQVQTRSDVIEQSISYFEKAIELRPLLADGYAGLGMAFVALGRDDDAIGALRRALSFASQNHRVHAALGRAYLLGKGNFRDAATEYEQTLKLNPEAGWAAQQLALCCAYIGDYERGEEAARLAIAAQEEYISGQQGVQLVGSFARLAHLHNLQGKYDDAVAECYREIVFLRTSNHALKERALIETNQKLVSAYVRQGNQDDAQEAFRQITKGFEARLAINADDPFTRYYVACASAMMGETERALEHLKKAIEGRRKFNAARARVEMDFENLRQDERFLTLIN